MFVRINKAFKQIINTKDGKTLLANFGYLSFLQVAGYIFPLLTMPYLARTIGIDGFGKIAFAAAIMLWVQTVSDWGFNFTATRDVAQIRLEKEAVSRIFSNVLWSRIFLCLIAFVMLLAAVLWIPVFNTNKDIILITFLTVIGHVFFPEWFFQALERMRYITFFNIIIKLLFTITVFLFIKEKNDYILQPVFTAMGYLVSGIGAFYIIIGKWGYRLHAPNFKTIIKTIKGSTDVFINTLLPNLYNSFSQMLLGLFGTSIHNGTFDGGNKFVTIIYQLEMVLSRTFFPFLSRRNDKHYIFVRINLLFSTIATILLYVSAPLIVSLFLGDEFTPSIAVMRIMSFSLIGITLSNIYGTNYLIIKHREREIRNITLVSSLFGMLISVPLVYYFNFIGASLAVLISRSMIGILALIRVKFKP